ncbi:formylmethanofuran dehydrogenase subunit A [Microvirga massiliensis]|uniref:formylmethanofuran dehydrogenase subunit A n=1 Tax=Microvirga massiliensis TaxID=1033741 RepID=UPI00062BA02E|nr:formylmethanofuran dehydrogenase subunit A [Microvirga massiliensis]
MLTRIKGGRIVDPVHGRDAVGDLWIEDGHVVEPPADPKPDEIIDANGCVVMAGGIDVHSHIASGNVILSRLLLPEYAVAEAPSPDLYPFAAIRRSAAEVGCSYACMGYTTVIEPALAPVQALTTHLELADIPLIDRGALSVLGNDDLLLSLLRERESPQAINDLVALTLATSRGLGVKVINAGGAVAFKEGATKFDLDDEVPSYGLTSRRILTALLNAVESLGVPHPLHVHCSNLGIPGADKTLVETMAASEGRRIHFAHAQFYSYAETEGGGFTSAAARVCDALARHPNATLDVGHVVFGPTCTLSLDILRQFVGRKGADPRKWTVVAGDAEGGGLVPFVYRHRRGTSALQFAIGLELMLLSPDPWRVLLTTDHPNGGPFTAYPRLLHLMMDKEERDRELSRIHPVIRDHSSIMTIDRELTMQEVAIITRAAPARLLGLKDRGHLGAGARADVAVYRDIPDRTAMFSAAEAVWKAGKLIVREGEVVDRADGKTLSLGIDVDEGMARRVDAYLHDRFGAGLESFNVPADAFRDRDPFRMEACLN